MLEARGPCPSTQKKPARAGTSVGQTESLSVRQNSAGELSTGACIGVPFCSCLVIRGYASAAAGYVGPAELQLCAALNWRKYLPSSTTD